MFFIYPKKYRKTKEEQDLILHSIMWRLSQAIGNCMFNTYLVSESSSRRNLSLQLEGDKYSSAIRRAMESNLSSQRVRPNPSLKPSPNGVSRRAASARPSAHSALAARHVTPSVPAYLKR